MPKVSVIIPFNNVETYILQCLESVKNQTLSDIEIILINDASGDKSREIAQNFIDTDNRFKIIDLPEQKGQGYARNRGIEIAQGEYIGFVDSDDFIEANMFEELYNSAKKDNTDITMCEVCEYDDINEKFIKSDYYSLSCLQNFKDKVFKAEDTKKEILNINVALWNKIYKREYLLFTNEKFPEGYIYEDLPYFFGTYLPAHRINIVWKVLYNYRVNRKNSTMRQFNNKILDRLPMVSLTYEKLKSVDFLKDMTEEIQGWIINDLFHRYVLLKENYHKEYFFLMKKIFESLEIKDLKSQFWKTIYHFKGYLLVMNHSFEDFNQKVFNEYLDIHEVENRLHCELENNYKYTDELNNSSTMKIRQEVKNGISKDLYNDIKDLSFVMHDNFVEFGKETNSINEKLNSVLADINEIKQNFENRFEQMKNKIYIELKTELKDELMQEIRNELQICAEKQSEACNNYIKDVNTSLLANIENLRKDIEQNNYKNNEIINSLTTEFRAVIEVQKLEYDAKIELLKNEMQELGIKLREEMKSPLTKFIEKLN